MSSNKIQIAIMLEVLGKPPEHLKETLENLSKKIDEEKGVKIINKTIHEPKKLKDKEDFFSSFAELEIELEELKSIALIVFKYMPSYVEIIYPEKITLTNTDCGEIFSELTRRLHGYDEVARVIQSEKKILEDKLRAEIQKNKK